MSWLTDLLTPLSGGSSAPKQLSAVPLSKEGKALEKATYVAIKESVLPPNLAANYVSQMLRAQQTTERAIHPALAVGDTSSGKVLSAVRGELARMQGAPAQAATALGALRSEWGRNRLGQMHGFIGLNRGGQILKSQASLGKYLGVLSAEAQQGAMFGNLARMGGMMA